MRNFSEHSRLCVRQYTSVQYTSVQGPEPVQWGLLKELRSGNTEMRGASRISRDPLFRTVGSDHGPAGTDFRRLHGVCRISGESG